MHAVLASDIKTSSRECVESGPFVHADVQDYESLARMVLEHGIDHAPYTWHHCSQVKPTAVR